MMHGLPNSILQDGADESKVSHFYGPGTYAAWYLTSLSVMLYTSSGGQDSTILTLRPNSLWPGADGPGTTSDTLDIDFIAILAYPFMASLDILLRCIFQTNPDAPSIAAAGHVVAAATIITSLGAMHTSDRNDRRAPKRHTIWIASWSLSMVSLSVAVTRMPDTFTLVSVGLGAFVGMMFAIMEATLDVPVTYFGRNMNLALVIFRDLMIFLLVTPKYFVPQTFSHLRDWDQLAVVFIAVVALLARYLR